jgi:hypothetical protein
MTLQEHYARIRRDHPYVPARHALEWARHALECDAILSAIDWREQGAAMIGELPDGVAIVVYDDSEPYDWGDIEPSEQDRRDLQVIGVAGRERADADDLDAIWGVGFLSGDWEREAVSAALEHGLIETARRELRERAEWAARDVETI